MKKKITTLALSFIALSTMQMTVQAEDDISKGKIAFETCRGCHSAVGYNNVRPSYYVPKVGGQVPAYTIAALTAYKESKRPHGTMKANSYDLSEKTMKNIGAYLASVGGSAKSIGNGGNITNGKKLAESCLACHSDDISEGATNPRLAGQHANDLEKAMQGYQSGERNNALMQSMLTGLSVDEIKDIAAYFSSLKGLTAVK